MPFFSEILNQNLTPKMGHFGFFSINQELRWNYFVNWKEYYIIRSHLRSPTKFKKG